ncbi:hypothetical protein HMPREF3198_02071 [Winkia neuii]|nr:hypothetical protein HMPREF3198_02071 [Winkia neuii]
MKKPNYREPSMLKALVASALIILITPLPLALYMSGLDWVLHGISAVPKEFLATYFLELGILIIGIAVFKVREKFFNK